MKQLATSYSFNPVAKTVTLAGLDVPLNHVLLIINATRNQIIYNLAEPALGAQSYQQGASSVITLKADLAGAANTDQLTIFYDNGAESQIVLVQGPVGPAGIDGQDGQAGTNGVDGQDGASAYAVAVANGYADTEANWLLSLKGADGVDGQDGQAGTNGVDGQDGQAGTNGVDGQDGASAYAVAVANGYADTEANWLLSLKGADGADGQDGQAGTNGVDGQDALWNFKGEYDNGGLYAVGDIVSYLGGSYYRLLPPNAGYPPSNATYWNVVASKGDTGTAGTTTWSGITDKPTEFAPTAHKSTHATGGTDALSPEDIGAQPAGSYATISQLAFPIPAPSVTLNNGFVELKALAGDGTEGANFRLYNFPTVVCNLPLSLRQNTFIEIVIFKRKTRRRTNSGTGFKRSRSFVVPAPHVTMPWGDNYSSRVKSVQIKITGNTQSLITMVRPNLYPAVHGEVINVYDYLNGRWAFSGVYYNSYSIVEQNVNLHTLTVGLFCPLPIHYHTLSDQLLSKFPYSKNFAPLKFAFRYVHWANGEIFEGPMSNTYKIWYQTFPFRQNHYYSSILGGAVSETVSAPNHFLKCALA